MVNFKLTYDNSQGLGIKFDFFVRNKDEAYSSITLDTIHFSDFNVNVNVLKFYQHEYKKI